MNESKSQQIDANLPQASYGHAAAEPAPEEPQRRLVPVTLHNLDFTSIQQRAILVSDGVKREAQASMKNRAKTSPSKPPSEGGSHLDGTVLTDLYPVEAMQKISAELRKKPDATALRVRLIKTFWQSRDLYEIGTYRDMLTQAILPIYVGAITPLGLQASLEAYNFYLQKLCETHKRDLLQLRSGEPSAMNTDTLALEDIVVREEEVEDSEELMRILEVKIAQKILEKQTSVMERLQTTMSIPLDVEEVNALSPGELNNKQQLVFRKAFSALDVMKELPLLHSIGLKIIHKMKLVDRRDPNPLLLEGRFYLSAVKLLMLRLKEGDRSVKPSLGPTLNKSIAAYHKAAKLTSKAAPNRNEALILAEFASTTYYAYLHRTPIALNYDGVMSLLEAGRDAVSAAVSVNQEYTPLQDRIAQALEQNGVG